MTNFQLRIIARAVKTRVARGEDLDTVLNSYANLLTSDKETIKKLIKSMPG